MWAVKHTLLPWQSPYQHFSIFFPVPSLNPVLQRFLKHPRAGDQNKKGNLVEKFPFFCVMVARAWMASAEAS